jgi:riboflavin kinase
VTFSWFPHRVSDAIVANLPDESITPLSTKAETGVYYGYAQVLPKAETRAEFAPEDLMVLPMVMSLGWNPFYKNERLTAVGHSLDNQKEVAEVLQEIHIMHIFPRDFYGHEMRAVVLGYIRPELDYVSRGTPV